jgi:acetylornithine/N-succinyldiaminopimelate aminotransferase
VVTPDIMTLGKAVGGGLPVGVMCAKPELAKLLVPGTHGSTLGGNAICMAVAKTIFDVIERDNLLENAATLGEHAAARLRGDARLAGKIAEVRGRGLFLGVDLAAVPEKFVERALERGVLINLTAGKVVRLAPPLNITRQQLDAGLDVVIDLIASA